MNRQRGTSVGMGVLVIVGICAILFIEIGPGGHLAFLVPGTYEYDCRHGYVNDMCPPRYVRLSRDLSRVQKGLERYAAEHQGKYPTTLAASDFPWERYMGDYKLRSPFNFALRGQALIDADIRVDPRAGRSVLAVARADARPFREPGMIRYYVDGRTRGAYALTIADEDGYALRDRYHQVTEEDDRGKWVRTKLVIRPEGPRIVYHN